eukprot:COSAG02_NODE_47843_length_338_cov_0.778243_2_plen_35_part_01
MDAVTLGSRVPCRQMSATALERECEGDNDWRKQRT